MCVNSRALSDDDMAIWARIILLKEMKDKNKLSFLEQFIRDM